MQKGYFHRVQEMTATRFWINNVTRKEADLAIAAGAVGCTQNPSYVNKILESADDKSYAFDLLDGILTKTDDDTEAEVMLQRELVATIAKRFLPLYNESGGKLGYVSIQGDPIHEDKDTIIRHARFNREAGPNIMAKIPVTVDGLAAIDTLLREGTPINATEVMCVQQALKFCEVYRKATAKMENPPVAYFSHIAGIFDMFLKEYSVKKKLNIPVDYLYQAGAIVAKKIARMVADMDCDVGFISGGARGLHHFTEWVGGAISVTINWVGAADKLIELDEPVVSRFHNQPQERILDTLLDRCDVFRQAYLVNAIEPHQYEEFGPVELFRGMFVDSWNNALKTIEAHRRK